MKITKKVTKKIVPALMVAMLATSLVACGNNEAQMPSDKSTTEATKQAEMFPNFQGKDFEGNSVDQSIFAKNEVTLLNFWFNGCSACVNEMPALEKFNAKLRERGAELIGVNVQVADNEADLKEAKEILSTQGATYRNIYITGDQDAKSYISKIFGFPTTIIVDKNGDIIGQPIVGSIEDEKKLDEILKVVDEVKAGRGVSASVSSSAPEKDKMTELIAEESNILSGEHKDLWNKLFDKVEKDKVQQDSNSTYDEFLKAQIEAGKDLFTEEELKMLNEDLKKITELEKQILELSKKN